MSRIKLLLDLIEDVRAVADDLQVIADAMTGEEATAVPAQEEPAEKAIRLEDVRAMLAAKSREGYGAQVRELIARHGGSRLSDIDPSEYGAMLKEVEAIEDAT